jgi:glycerol uptake facilitator-like aquaporin
MRTVLPLLAEYLGTFLLTLAYLSTSNILTIGVLFFIILFLILPISGACLNPAVSWVMYLKGNLGYIELLYYVVIQLLAGTTAFYVQGLLE